jgi:hypothetical protein
VGAVSGRSLAHRTIPTRREVSKRVRVATPVRVYLSKAHRSSCQCNPQDQVPPGGWRIRPGLFCRDVRPPWDRRVIPFPPLALGGEGPGGEGVTRGDHGKTPSPGVVAHTFRRPLAECMRPWEWAARRGAPCGRPGRPQGPPLRHFRGSRSCPSADRHPESMKMREAPWSAAA